MKVKTIKINAYEVISRAIEEGLEFGWNHAHKYTDTPDKDSIIEHMQNDIMNSLSEVIDWEE